LLIGLQLYSLSLKTTSSTSKTLYNGWSKLLYSPGVVIIFPRLYKCKSYVYSKPPSLTVHHELRALLKQPRQYLCVKRDVNVAHPSDTFIERILCLSHPAWDSTLRHQGFGPAYSVSPRLGMLLCSTVGMSRSNYDTDCSSYPYHTVLFGSHYWMDLMMMECRLLSDWRIAFHVRQQHAEACPCLDQKVLDSKNRLSGRASYSTQESTQRYPGPYRCRPPNRRHAHNHHAVCRSILSPIIVLFRQCCF